MKRIIILFILCLVLLLTFQQKQSDDVLTVVNPFPNSIEALEKYVDAFEKDTGVVVEIYTPSADQTVNELVEEMIIDNNPPDIFPIAGYNDFLIYEDILYTMNDQKWTNDTDFEYSRDGIVYGFPITMEGSGMLVNTKYIEELGVDYKTVNSYEEFTKLVLDLEQHKEELGFASVFGFSFEPNSDDTKILLDIMFNGNVASDITSYFTSDPDALDLTNYAELVDLIFTHCSTTDLFATSDTIEENFAAGEYVFMFGTTEVIMHLIEHGMDMDYLDIMPCVYNDLSSDRITILIPYYWSVNKYGSVDESLLFLNNLIYTPYGQDYLSKDTPFTSPFKGMPSQTYKINESIVQYYNTKHFSLGYVNSSNEYLEKIYNELYLEFYYSRDYEAFITEIENASYDIEHTLGKE